MKSFPVGAVELGYGIDPAYWGRGYAAEIVESLVASGHADARIAVVRAKTSVANIASRRVLEKNGFERTGRRDDPEDGLLDLWRVPA